MANARRFDRFRALVWHFFDRFFDKESLSTNGEAETNVVQTLGILAVPGAMFVLVLQPLTVTGWSLVGARYFALSFSMVVMGLVMVFQWDALFPDRRDYTILTPLPLRLSTLFFAKLAALGIFLGLFLVDVNFFAMLFWPGVDNGKDLFGILGAHAAAMVAGGLFSALALGALQGVLMTFLSAKAFRRVAVAMQTVLMAVLTMLLFLTPVFAVLIRRLARDDMPALYWFPGYWFLGLYEWMRPAVRNPGLLRMGHIGVQALCIAAGLFVLSYLPLYRRHARKMIEAPAPRPAGPGRMRRRVQGWLNRMVVRHPVERAAFHFISQTITRSAKHRLFLATYGGFGAALAVSSLDAGRSGLMSLPLMLSFVLVSGLRAAFNFPAELRANLVFQLSESESSSEHLSATRKWIVACGIVPLFLLVSPMEIIVFGWGQALFHFAFGVAISVLLMEIMFFGFRKVPFTCSYFPGKVNLVGLSVMYVFGFTAYSRLAAGLEAWLAETPAAAAAFFGAAALARWSLLRWRDHTRLSSPALEYEDVIDPAVRTLDLGVG